MKLRTNMLALALSAAFLLPAHAQETELTVVGVGVHEAAMRGVGVPGGVNALESFERANEVKVNVNVETGPGIVEALPRLGTLNSSTQDIIFVSQLMSHSRIAGFLAPLDEYLSANSIAGFPDQWVTPPVEAGTVEGKHYLVPLRCGVWIFWGNKQYLADHGVGEPPKTPEALYDAAKKATFTKPNGEKVYGFAIRGINDQVPSGFATIGAMFGGSIIDKDGKVTVNEPAMVQAAEYLHKMYAEGIMPPNWSSVDPDELFRSGRLSMVVSNDNFTSRFEAADALGPKGTLAFHVPIEDALRVDGVDYAGSQSFYWGAGILKGSKKKTEAYELIRFLAQPETEAAMMKNRNQPCRASTLAKLGETVPANRIGIDTLTISRPPMPAHPQLSQANDAVAIAVQDIVVNGASAQDKLDELAEELTAIYE